LLIIDIWNMTCTVNILAGGSSCKSDARVVVGISRAKGPCSSFESIKSGLKLYSTSILPGRSIGSRQWPGSGQQRRQIESLVIIGGWAVYAASFERWTTLLKRRLWNKPALNARPAVLRKATGFLIFIEIITSPEMKIRLYYLSKL